MERVKPQSVLCVGRQPCSQQPQPMIRPPYLHILSDAMLSAFTVTTKTLFIPLRNICKRKPCSRRCGLKHALGTHFLYSDFNYDLLIWSKNIHIYSWTKNLRCKGYMGAGGALPHSLYPCHTFKNTILF